MLFDPNTQHGYDKAIKYIEKIKAENGLGELTSKASKSANQNSYLHIVIRYIAVHESRTEEYVKQKYVKEVICRDIFLIRSRYDRVLNKFEDNFKSTRKLTKEEASLAIDRIINWANITLDLHIPSVDEYNENKDLKKQILKDIDNAKYFI